MPIYVDLDRCVGCRSCEVACQRVHKGRSHINVYFSGDRASVPLVCHHCDEAACTMVCYSEALTTEGETTQFNLEKCTGCGLCALACPFGVIWTDKYAHKCDFCSGEPACVTTCPANALSVKEETVTRRARAAAASFGARR